MTSEKKDIEEHRLGIFNTILVKLATKIGIAAVVVVGLVYVVIYLIDSSTRAISNIAESFNSGKVVTEFHDYITKLEGQNHLQVAQIKSVDTFSRSDSASILWNLITLPNVKIEIQIPVEYSYYIDLKQKWEFKWEENEKTVTVLAPGIQCNTPAIDISNMKIVEKEGSFLRDVEGVKEKLRSELSERLKLVAIQKIPFIREIARKETEQFIQNWFLKFYFKESEFKPKYLFVYFTDESNLPKQSTPMDLQIKG